MKDFGLSQINDVHLAKLFFYQVSSDLFESIAIADGFSIVFNNMKKNPQRFDYIYRVNGMSCKIEIYSLGNNLIPLNPIDGVIKKKISNKVSEKHYGFLHDSVLSQKLFSIENDFVSIKPTLVKALTVIYRLNEDEIKLYK